MRHIIFALFFGISTATLAQQPIELAPDAPDHHVVVRGDTLWGIAARFLKDPFRWPDVWRMNAAQVNNPHRIYPGQVVVLDRSDGQPRLKLAEVKLAPSIRVEQLSAEIPAIPPQAIEPFLSQPLVIDLAQFEKAPRIVATQENRLFTAHGDAVYATGVDPGVKLWQVYRPGKPLLDPETKAPLGVEAIFLGNAHLVEPGEPAHLVITKGKQEIGRGDYLVPAPRPELLSYIPRAPASPMDGRVIDLYGGVGEGGRLSVISLSRGKADGVEMGHVLALYRAGQTVSNRFDGGRPQVHTLPDERYGLLFVFRVFERVSYGLVIEAARPVVPGDRIRQP